MKRESMIPKPSRAHELAIAHRIEREEVQRLNPLFRALKRTGQGPPAISNKRWPPTC